MIVKDVMIVKFFHTADWHLGKLVQGVHMTEDQAYILQQFIQAVQDEQPDAVIVAGDLYDRAVPPTEAVHLLDKVLDEIVLDMKIPVLAIAGNHDSPGRLHFGSKMMRENGYHIVGRLTEKMKPVVLNDEHGDVHFHLIPYADPSTVRNIFQDDDVRTHHQAMEKIVQHIVSQMDPKARHVFVGHAFVTPYGEEGENTSDSERPLSIGGAEYVGAELFSSFHYTALGHLHQAHRVHADHIRYAGSILKYSISEENHKKGYYIVELGGEGKVTIEKRDLVPVRDMRTVEGILDDLLTHSVNEDYVFVRLLDDTPVLSPMEKIRTVYPNAMHVERKIYADPSGTSSEHTDRKPRHQMSDIDLFRAFYEEVKGQPADEETEHLFKDILEEQLKIENETVDADKTKADKVSN